MRPYQKASASLYVMENLPFRAEGRPSRPLILSPVSAADGKRKTAIVERGNRESGVGSREWKMCKNLGQLGPDSRLPFFSLPFFSGTIAPPSVPISAEAELP